MSKVLKGLKIDFDASLRILTKSVDFFLSFEYNLLKNIIY